MRPGDEKYDTEEYRALPEVVRVHLTAKEYAWLSNDERHRLLDDFTQPSSGYVDL